MARILVVDDRAENRQFLVKLLGYFTHEMLEADDGQMALELARQRRPDLIISDIFMPEMDGFDLVRKLRADPEVGQTPVVFYTATYLVSQVQDLARELGVYFVLEKPSKPKTIIETVNHALNLPALSKPLLSEKLFEEHEQLIRTKFIQKLDMAQSRVEALVALNLELSAQTDPRLLLEHSCHSARQIIGAKYALLGVVHDARHAAQGVFTSGMDAELAAQFEPAEAQARLAEPVVARGNTLRTRLSEKERPAGLPPASAMLLVPVQSPKQVYGWLCLLEKLGEEEFSAEDERLASILAAQVGRTYENGSLLAEVRLRVAELDREIVLRQKAEEALQQAQDRLQHLVSATPAVIYALKLEGDGSVPTWVSRSIVRLTGFEEQEAIQAKWWEQHVHPDDRARALDAMRKLLAQGSGVTEYRIRAKDGTYRWVYDEQSLIRDAAGQPVEVVGSWTDITARRQAEQALRDSEARLLEITENSREVLWLVNADVSEILYVSPAFETIWGRTCQSLYQDPQSWVATIHPEDLPSVRAAIKKQAQGETATYEYRVLRPDGSVRAARSRGFPIRDEAGRVVRVVGTTEDITDRQQLEEQFRQAQKMEAVGRLAGGIAHDFNNLLTVINGYSEMLLEKLRQGDPLRGIIDQIHKSGSRAAGLTRQLLAFSRKQILMPVVLDLNTLLTEMDKMLRRLIGEDIDLALSLEPKLWRVKADPGQLEQVVMNIAINARDAMPQGGKLTIETSNIELDDSYVSNHQYVQAGQHVRLAISDTGCGMGPATQARIFEPFFTTKGPEKGTGLGLATVYGIVKQSGGSIEVYSEVGVGTTFKIYLPRSDAVTPLPKSPSGTLKTVRGSETILLVEDDAGVRQLTRAILGEQGYTILEAANGGEALLRCEQHHGPIHLLITDVVMPNLSGPQLVERLAPLRPSIKVLYFSGYTDEAVVRHGQIGPETPFLQKPFKPEVLVRRVREVLDDRSHSAPAFEGFQGGRDTE